MWADKGGGRVGCGCGGLDGGEGGEEGGLSILPSGVSFCQGGGATAIIEY